MKGKIMVIFDSRQIRKEALQYAIELAKRTDCSVMSLVLLDPSQHGHASGGNLESLNRQTFNELTVPVRQAGLVGEAEIRTGNPSSELMKFLADCRSPRAIVWGGVSGVDGSRRQRDHWLGRVKDRLGCPVVVPALKTDTHG
ncbi:MAG: universal stress protein [Desulfobacterales bacterium]